MNQRPSTSTCRSRCVCITRERRTGSYLLIHGYVVTVDEERRVFPDGWIEVDGDSITGVGAMVELPESQLDGGDGSRETIDLRGMLTMPGLINGHNHHWGSLFKNTGEGLLAGALAGPDHPAARRAALQR